MRPGDPNVFGPRELIVHAISVLVVEDEPLVRMAASDVLQAGGLRVFEASDAEEATMKLSTGHVSVDVLFANVNFPRGRNGSDLVDWARDRCPTLTVVVTAGQVTGHDVQSELLASEAFIKKPYDFRGFARRLRSLRAQRDD